MTFRTIRLPLVLIVLLGLLVGTAAAHGHRDHWGRTPDFQRFSFSLSGGFGLGIHGQAMLDTKAELQLALTRRVRVGLGVGYLGSEGGRGYDHRRVEPLAASTTLTGSPEFERLFERGRESRILPVSLNLYYVFPLGYRWGVYALAGGSYYFGEFHGPDGRAHQDAWGGQAGIGAEYRLGRRFRLMAEGTYRLVGFHGGHRFRSEDGVTPAATTVTANDWGGNDRSPILFHSAHLDLSGFSLRLGARIGF